jgi:hypothetical protein
MTKTNGGTGVFALSLPTLKFSPGRYSAIDANIGDVKAAQIVTIFRNIPVVPGRATNAGRNISWARPTAAAEVGFRQSAPSQGFGAPELELRDERQSEIVHLTALRPHLRSAKIVRGCKVKRTIQTYNDLVELARICLKQAREAKSAFVSDELTHVAKGYQVRAATMNQGRFPDIGDEATAS